MICNICGTKEATIHLTEIVNGKMAEVHICESCAEEKGTEFKTYFNFGDLLAGAADAEGVSGGTGKKITLVCKDCGMNYEDFAKNGRLGCAGCYAAFQKPLAALIKQVQRSNYHVGKKPSRIPKGTRNIHDLRQLQEQLRKSIQTEAFEEAARLRDEIKQAEEKLKKGKKAKGE
ncbi:MAG TPA: UvrB/UvrC motif-containing protein [Candidatus Omnitrophota bacterium]|nr:UvrB/UvrC motif-containing protein [Candidatus Omnitrophota bacterium]HRY85922.1 UvrB/UvrC motif-containing protein [Candidatus Omnitrophota bacterium]